MISVGLVALALATAPVEGCVTTCGLRAPLEADPMVCQELQLYETATLRAFSRSVQGWTYERTCPALQDWSVLVVLNGDDTGAWYTPDGFHVLGLTMLEEHITLVGKNRWVDSSLAHELAHVIEHRLNEPEAQGNHERWTERGICPAVNEVSRWFHNDCAHPAFSNYVKPNGAFDWLQR